MLWKALGLSDSSTRLHWIASSRASSSSRWTGPSKSTQKATPVNYAGSWINCMLSTLNNCSQTLFFLKGNDTLLLWIQLDIKCNSALTKYTDVTILMETFCMIFITYPVCISLNPNNILHKFCQIMRKMCLKSSACPSFSLFRAALCLSMSGLTFPWWWRHCMMHCMKKK